MSSEKFRRQLRQETEQWRQKGWINTELYQTLSDYYQLTDLEQDARHRFNAILLGLGSILLGLGVITYVAANWQGWPREFRVVLLLSLFIATNGSGFHLWKSGRTAGLRRLGQGFLLLGALVMGANMGLMSQMFHQSGSVFELFLIWGLGVTLMAASLRFTPLGILALILVSIGYACGLIDRFSATVSPLLPLINHTPLLIAAVFIPLAYFCRSLTLFGFSAIVLIFALVGNLLTIGRGITWPWLYGFVIMLPPALLWGYAAIQSPFPQQNDRLGGSESPELELPNPYGSLSQSLALLYLSLLLYVLSYNFWWRSLPGENYYYSPQAPLQFSLFIDSFIFAGLTCLCWWRLLRQFSQRPITGLSLNTGTLLITIVLAGGLTIAHLQWGPLGGWATFGYNVLLFILSIALVRDGLAQGLRRTFWSGMLLLVLSLLTRMLEYNTDLLFKALVFVMCGILVIGAGIWFERNVRPTSSSTANSNLK